MANQIREEKVLSDYFEHEITTKINLGNYFTLDNDLAENAGMTKQVEKISWTGNVEDVAEEAGNTTMIETTSIIKDYTVKTTQGKSKYTDELKMKNPKIVDSLLIADAEAMTNDLTSKVVRELGKGSKSVSLSGTAYFDAFADARAEFEEDGEELFAFVSFKDGAKIRKALKDDLKYIESFVKTGYIGTVAGINVIETKAMKENVIYVANKKAVTLFNKMGSVVDTARDVEHRINYIYPKKVMLVALTNDNKIVKIASAGTTPTITTTSITSTTKSIGGACADGNYIEVYYDDAYLCDGVVSNAGTSSATWTANVPDGKSFVAGKKIYVKSISEIKSTTVSAESTVA